MFCLLFTLPSCNNMLFQVAILSRFYGVEMAVVDTLNAIINRFGEDKNYGQRVFLLFDGVHYDPLYLEQADVSVLIFRVALTLLKHMTEAEPSDVY